MFEKFSGFFKRFTRRRKKQSGETTIMDGKDSGLEELGLDEGFGEMGDLGQSGGEVGTAPAGSESESEVPFADSDFQTGSEEFSTGASDFDERTISDEISGVDVAPMPEMEAAAPEAFAVPAEEEAPFAEAEVEPTPVSFVKRVFTLAIAAVIAVIVGGAFQLFLWPVVAQRVGLAKSAVPQVDVHAALMAEQQKNTKLKGEVAQFKGLGSPAEVKTFQQKLTEARDAQGPIEDVENKYNQAKEREAAYEELLKKVEGLHSDIGKAQSDIADTKSQIGAARVEVAVLQKQTDEEYARFRVELARAEINQRMVIELQMEDNRSFSAELDRLQERLSQLSPAIQPQAAAEAAPEFAPGIETEVVPEIPSEPTQEITETAPEAPSELAPEIQPEQAPEAQPEQAPQIQPEQAPEAQAGQASEAQPENESQAGPGLAPEGVAPTVPDVPQGS